MAVAEPTFPSLVALIVAVPGAMPVTVPVGETVAIAVEELDHVTGRSVTTAPAESRTMAAACALVPTWIALPGSDTATEPTGTGLTMSAALAVTLSAVAVIAALPTARALTSPESEMVAMLALELFQATWTPESKAPFASLGDAVNRVFSPRTSAACEGLSSSNATFGVGVVGTGPDGPYT